MIFSSVNEYFKKNLTIEMRQEIIAEHDSYFKERTSNEKILLENGEGNGTGMNKDEDSTPANNQDNVTPRQFNNGCNEVKRKSNFCVDDKGSSVNITRPNIENYDNTGENINKVPNLYGQHVYLKASNNDVQPQNHTKTRNPSLIRPIDEEQSEQTPYIQALVPLTFNSEIVEVDNGLSPNTMHHAMTQKNNPNTGLEDSTPMDFGSFRRINPTPFQEKVQRDHGISNFNFDINQSSVIPGQSDFMNLKQKGTIGGLETIIEGQTNMFESENIFESKVNGSGIERKESEILKQGTDLFPNDGEAFEDIGFKSGGGGMDDSMPMKFVGQNVMIDSEVM